jgi:predicted alpha/beta-fold hydrolase
MDEAMARVLAVPSSPAPRRIAALARTGLPDLPLALVSTVPALSSLGWRYPRVFRPRSLPGADGEPMAALVALQPIGPAPALIVAHGATTTKAFDYVRRASLRAYAAGFHVLAPDLRGYGVTGLIAEAPTSLGAEEGRDLLAAADWLRERGATSVAAVGYSLGGAAVLSAARRDPRAGGLDGGALAVSAPTDLWATLQHISTRPRLRDPAFFNWLALRADAIARARAAGWTHETVSPLELVGLVSAPWYGLDVQELARRASATLWADDIRAPTLVLHGLDDLVVPVSQARAFARHAEANDRVRVLVRPTGRHTLFDVLDPAWTRDVERAWFDAWARRPAPPDVASAA